MEAERAVSKFKGGLRKVFKTLQDAEDWLGRHAKAAESGELIPFHVFHRHLVYSHHVRRSASSSTRQLDIGRSAPLQQQGVDAEASAIANASPSPSRTPRSRAVSRQAPYVRNLAQLRSPEAAEQVNINRAAEGRVLSPIPIPQATPPPSYAAVQREDRAKGLAAIAIADGSDSEPESDDPFTEDEGTPSWVAHIMSPRSPGSPTARLFDYRDASPFMDEDEEVAAQLIPPCDFETYAKNITFDPPLSQEQRDVLKRVYDGESLFFTGPAGVGKSVLTREIIKALRRKYYAPNAVAVTAFTGIAAANVGGGTLHSWAGCGLAKPSAHKLYSFLTAKAGGYGRRKEPYARWMDCKVLIIDEGTYLIDQLVSQ